VIGNIRRRLQFAVARGSQACPKMNQTTTVRLQHISGLPPTSAEILPLRSAGEFTSVCRKRARIARVALLAPPGVSFYRVKVDCVDLLSNQKVANLPCRVNGARLHLKADLNPWWKTLSLQERQSRALHPLLLVVHCPAASTPLTALFHVRWVSCRKPLRVQRRGREMDPAVLVACRQ